MAIPADTIFVVSGLPRSGTSMLMRMLEAGGLPSFTDGERTADEDNPRGYYELEAVKRTDKNDDWLDGAGGRAVKVISQLLGDLPTSRKYKVVFIRRNLDEILASQKKMLARRGEQNDSSDDEMKEMFVVHVDEIEAWLQNAEHMDVLYVSYNRIMSHPAPQAARINRFFGGFLDEDAMRSVVEPDLYRNRAEG